MSFEKIIPIRNREELEGKAQVKKDVEAAVRALDVAIEGRGGKGVPNEAKRAGLETLRAQVAGYIDYLMAKELEHSDPHEVYGLLVGVKLTLAEYLTDEQYVEIFGTDIIA